MKRRVCVRKKRERKEKRKIEPKLEKKRFPKAVRGLSPADLTPPFSTPRAILDIILIFQGLFN